MTEYTLHYFSARGRGELIRLIFKQAGKEFTDHRIPDFSAWPEEQKNGAIYHEFIFYQYYSHHFCLNHLTSGQVAVGLFIQVFHE